MIDGDYNFDLPAALIAQEPAVRRGSSRLLLAEPGVGPVGEKVFDCEPGDVLWIPKDTSLQYASEGRAEVFYALYPVDWNEGK